MSGAISDVHCIMFARPIQENQRDRLPGDLAFLRGDYPGWNHLLTFSTGFSTTFVKKKWGFPHSFPLFPPSFPPKTACEVIRGVFQGAKKREPERKNGAKHLFSKRKSGCRIYFMRLFPGERKMPFPTGIFLRPGFPQTTLPADGVWKTVGKPG